MLSIKDTTAIIIISFKVNQHNCNSLKTRSIIKYTYVSSIIHSPGEQVHIDLIIVVAF